MAEFIVVVGKICIVGFLQECILIVLQEGKYSFLSLWVQVLYYGIIGKIFIEFAFYTLVVELLSFIQ